MHLLNETGYRPQLNECVSCHAPLQPVINSFSSSAGGMLCPNCHRSQTLTRPLSVNAQKVLRLLQFNDYDAVSKLKIDQQLSNELEGVIRGYLKYLLEREIKSAAWLDSLREKIIY
jgi:DNA repair protein RecO (recombination protein O)